MSDIYLREFHRELQGGRWEVSCDRGLAVATANGFIILPVISGGSYKGMYQCDMTDTGWLSQLRDKRWFSEAQEKAFMRCVIHLNLKGVMSITRDDLLNY